MSTLNGKNLLLLEQILSFKSRLYFNGANHPWNQTGHGCSKLTMLLVNVLLQFQTLISQTCGPLFLPIFFVEKMSEAFAMQKLLSFVQQKISV